MHAGGRTADPDIPRTGKIQRIHRTTTRPLLAAKKKIQRPDPLQAATRGAVVHTQKAVCAMTQELKDTQRHMRVAHKDKKSGMTQGQKHVVPRHKDCTRDLVFGGLRCPSLQKPGPFGAETQAIVVHTHTAVKAMTQELKNTQRRTRVSVSGPGF